MVNFKSIAEKAKGVFKKGEKKEGEAKKKPEDLLNEIKKYEKKISKKDFSGPGMSELKEEVAAGNISDKSYKDVMDALDIKDEGAKTGPKKPVPKPGKKPEQKPEKKSEKGKQKPEEQKPEQDTGKGEEKKEKKPTGVKVSPKKDETPSQSIMRAMGGASEEKLDKIIQMLEEIKQNLPTKKKTRKKRTKRKKSKKKDYKSMTKKKLYNIAKKLDISGRSSMTKNQLIKAVKKAKK